MTFKTIRSGYADPSEHATTHPENSEDTATKTISWKVVATTAGAILVLATTWVTTISSVSWDLVRNCDLAQADLTVLKQHSASAADAIIDLQRRLDSGPSAEELRGTVSEAIRLRECVTTNKREIDELKQVTKDLAARIEAKHPTTPSSSASPYMQYQPPYRRQ